MTYIAYFLLILLLGFGVILVEPGPGWQLIFAALVIGGHGLVFLKIKAQRTLMKSRTSILDKYPELASVAASGLVWIFVIITHGLPVLLSAAAVMSALIVCYGAARGITIGITKAGNLLGPLPRGAQANSFAAARLAIRVIYLLRVGLATGAVGVLLMLASGRAVPSLWVLLLAGLIVVFVVGLVVVTYQTEKTGYHRHKAAIRLHIAADLLVKAPEIAIYYSSKAKSHARLIALIAHLTEAGLRYIVICREAKPLAALKSKTPHAYMAKTIDSLDTFVTPSLKVVLYLNDAEKNGHFIRFNHLHHIFLAQAHHVPDGVVPRNYAIYDMLVAPNRALYDQWGGGGNHGLNTRLVYIDTMLEKRPLTQALSLPSPDGALVLGCSIPPADDQNTWQAKQAWLNTLIAAVTAHENPPLRLLLRFEPVGQDQAPIQKALIANMLNYAKQVEQLTPQSLPQIEVTKDNTNDCYNWADILICETSANLTALAQTGKPLIYAGAKTDQIPKNAYFYDGNSGSLAVIFSKIATADRAHKPDYNVPDTPPNPDRFMSSIHLLTAVLATGGMHDGHH